MKPKILISSERDDPCAKYTAAILAAGGLPTVAYCPQVSLDYDGLLLSGGGDIAPHLFDAEDRGSQDIDYDRDMAELELLALDSKESFQDNRQFYRQRLEAEDMPAIRGLLVQDRQHLDSVQTTMASSREFCFVLRRRKTDGAMNYAPLEQQFRDCGFVVQRAEGQRLLELLAIYFEQDATHEVFYFVDGAQWLTTETEV